jgi:hypothetical protein
MSDILDFSCGFVAGSGREFGVFPLFSGEFWNNM